MNTSLKCYSLLYKYSLPIQLRSLQQLHSKILTHYEVLGLSKDCTQDEIKKAFIHLSKEYHPDKQTGEAKHLKHSKFVLLNEANTTLSNPRRRALYDASLKFPKHSPTVHYRTNHQRYGAYRDTSFWEHRDPNQDNEYKYKSSFGMSWLDRKHSNSSIVTGILLFIILGICGQYTVARWFSKWTRERAERKSQKISIIYEEVRKRAKSNQGSMSYLQYLSDNSKQKSK